MHKEIDFENDIEHALISSGGYEKGDPNTYDPETALFPADVVAFVQKTQPKIWTRLTQLDAAKAPTMLRPIPGAPESQRLSVPAP